MDFQSFAVYTQSGVLLPVPLEHILFVCALITNQNIKLIFAPLDVSHTELYEFLVCDMNSKECMFHRSPNCPENTKMLQPKLYELIGDYDYETVIEFSQWTSTDKANSISCCGNVPPYMPLVIQQLKKLTAHCFIAKYQSNYLRELKGNLEENEVTILLLVILPKIIVLLCKMRCKDFTGITFNVRVICGSLL